MRGAGRDYQIAGERWRKVGEIDFDALKHRCGDNAAKVVSAMVDGEWAGTSTALIADIAGLDVGQAYRAIRRLVHAGMMIKGSGVISSVNWEIVESALPCKAEARDVLESA
jgi:hypothetical protein